MVTEAEEAPNVEEMPIWHAKSCSETPYTIDDLQAALEMFLENQTDALALQFSLVAFEVQMQPRRTYGAWESPMDTQERILKQRKEVRSLAPKLIALHCAARRAMANVDPPTERTQYAHNRLSHHIRVLLSEHHGDIAKTSYLLRSDGMNVDGVLRHLGI